MNLIAPQESSAVPLPPKGRLCLPVGRIIDGTYEIIRHLGAGTMGEVYLCAHRKNPSTFFAMKVLRLSERELAANPELLARFENEVESSYLVDHPNVVSSFAFVQEEEFVGFTMEYVPGGDLADFINSTEQIPVSRVVKLLSQACSGLQAIHNAGIIHRDIKPENLLLTKNGNIKITDFGIARVENGKNLTAHGGLLGTIDYLSPEYLLNGTCDERSDIYALGLIGYELITGNKPFKGETVVDVIRNKMNAELIAPHLVRPSCPKTLSDVILKALEREPELRYQKASAMLADLTAVIYPIRHWLKTPEGSEAQRARGKERPFPSANITGNLDINDSSSTLQQQKRDGTKSFGRKRGPFERLLGLRGKKRLHKEKTVRILQRRSLCKTSSATRLLTVAPEQKKGPLQSLRKFFLTLGRLPFRLFSASSKERTVLRSRVSEVALFGLFVAASLAFFRHYFL